MRAVIHTFRVEHLAMCTHSHSEYAYSIQWSTSDTHRMLLEFCLTLILCHHVNKQIKLHKMTVDLEAIYRLVL